MPSTRDIGLPSDDLGASLARRDRECLSVKLKAVGPCERFSPGPAGPGAVAGREMLGFRSRCGVWPPPSFPNVLNGYMGIEARKTSTGAGKHERSYPRYGRRGHLEGASRRPPALDRGVGAFRERRGRVRGAGGLGRRLRCAGGVRVHRAVAPADGGEPGRPAAAGAGERAARAALRAGDGRGGEDGRGGRAPRWGPRWRCGAWSRARRRSATSTNW